MKKSLVLVGLLIAANTAFCQQEENGTIYIRHPNIDAVHNTVKGYVGKDMAALKTLYSDTARWWASGMAKSVPIAEAMKMWMSDFDVFDSITVKQEGYPDYLHYKDQDAKTVQSWWTMSGKSKKTGEVVMVPIFQLDDFDAGGKITRESIYGDFSQWNAAASGNEEPAVRQVISDLQKALQANDPNALDSIYADNYTFVRDDGKLITKSERLADIKSGNIKFRSINIRVSDLKMYGDVAVAFMDVTVKATFAGKRDDGHFLTTGTFTRNNGRWVELAASSVRLPN